MTSTFSTVVNFNVLEITHRLRRIDIQGDIACKLGKCGYEFKSKHNGYIPSEKLGKIFDMPSNDDIFQTIMEAKSEAIQDSKLFGLCEDIDEIPIQLISIKLNENEQDFLDQDDYDDSESGSEDDEENECDSECDEFPDGLSFDYSLINFSSLNIQNYEERKFYIISIILV